MLNTLRTIFHMQGSGGNSSNDKKNDEDKKLPLESKENKNPKNNKTGKKKMKLSTILWIVLGVLFLILLLTLIFSPNVKQLSNDQLKVLMSQGLVFSDPNSVNIYIYLYSDYFSVVLDFTSNVTAQSSSITSPIKFNEGTYGTYWPYAWDSYTLISNLSNAGVKILVRVPTTPLFLEIIFSLLPWIIFFGLGWFIIKILIDKQTGQLGVGKSSAKPEMSNVKFKDVAGYEEIKVELQELVDFLKDPAKFSKAGARTPKGVLLAGPPGTGKTLFAKAIAGEAGIPFFSLSGSDFVEMFVGVGASRVRSLFKNAKEIAPALIFIDELDAVGRRRGGSQSGSNDEREQTLNQLLVEMDGFVSNSGIIIIAATNRPDVLDPALKRPGRFDREILLRLPDIREREEILKRHARGKQFENDVDWRNIGKRTPGFSGAELENVLNEAAILSIRENRTKISVNDIDEAIDRVIGGPSKANNVMSLEEKKLVAYHEAGHALIGLKLKHAQKVQKISIVPRGDAGGYVLMTPKKEKFVQTKAELIAQITSYMGGRVSEEIFFGKDAITTGAYSDIEEATKIARHMVLEFGMSVLGPIQFLKSGAMEMYGQESTNVLSDKLKNDIDKEIFNLINDAYEQAYEIIVNNKEMIEIFAEALMIKETINTEEIEYIYKNMKIPEEFYSFREKRINKTNYVIEEFETKSGLIFFASPLEIEKIKKAIILREQNEAKQLEIDKKLQEQALLNSKPDQNGKDKSDQNNKNKLDQNNKNKSEQNNKNKTDQKNKKQK